MTKKELIEVLEDIPDDFEVYYERYNKDGRSNLCEINIIGYIDYSEEIATLQI